MMSSALWYTDSALHVTGWPTPSNYDPIRGRGFAYPNQLTVETTIRPANEGAGVLVGERAIQPAHQCLERGLLNSYFFCSGGVPWPLYWPTCRSSVCGSRGLRSSCC
jgi:hypothetical protein